MNPSAFFRLTSFVVVVATIGLVAMVAPCCAQDVTAKESATPQPAQSAPGATAAYASAAALQDQGLFDLAADEWRGLLGAFPGDPVAPRARYNLGVCLFQSAKYTAAAEQFAKVAKPDAYPEIAEQAMANLGLAQFNAEQLNTALETFADLLTAYPKGSQAPTALLYRGEAFAMLGQHRNAANAFRQLVADFPQSELVSAATLGQAGSQIELGQHADAIRMLDELVKTTTEPATLGQAYRLRGDAHLAAAKFAEAATDYRLAGKQPGVADAPLLMQREAYSLYQAGKYADAVEVYDRLAATWPDSPSAAAAKLSAAKCLVTAGEHRQAIERLQSLWSADPTAGNVQAAHWLVRCHLALRQDLAQAQPIVDAALATKPDATWAAELAMDRADLLSLLPGSKSAAVEAYAILAVQHAGEPIGHRAAVLAAQTALDTGDAERAAELANLALAREGVQSIERELLQTIAEAKTQLGQPDEAIATYRKLLANYPADERRPAWSLRLATALASQQEWTAAAELLEPLLDQLVGGEFVTAATQLAQAQREQGNLSGSVTTLTRVIKRFPSPPQLPRLLYDRGRTQTTLGQLEEATTDFQQVLRQFPEHSVAPYARFALASNQFALGQFEACADTIQPITQDGPADLQGPARFLLASAQQELQQYADALAMLEGATAPAAELLYLRGVCQSRLGRVRAAQASLEASLTADGAEAVADRALYELAWVQDGSDLQAKADGLFARLADEYPGSPLAAEANYRVGESRYRSQDFDQAASRLAKAVAAAGDDGELREQAMHLVGWVQFESGDPSAAMSTFSEQLREWPEGSLAADAKLMQAECQFALQDYAAASELFQQAVDAQTLRVDLRVLGLLHWGQALGQREAWGEALTVLDRAAAESDASGYANMIQYERAWSLHKLERNDEARELLASLAESATGVLSARSRFVLGELQFAAAEYEQAVRTFFKVAYGYGGKNAPAEFHPWQSQALFEAARCLEQLNRSRPARKLYAELVERFPESEKATHARERLQPTAQR